MVQVADAGTKASPAKAGGSGTPPANPKAWQSAQQASPFGPRQTPTPPVPTPAGPPAPTQAPPRQAQSLGHLGFTGGAGVGVATSTPVPDAPAQPGTLTAPYDPSKEINRLKSDSDTATFAVSAGAGVAVVTPWTGPVNVGPQAGAGYIATVKQVGGGGPGQPATDVPPQYTVTLDKNQSAGVYGVVNMNAGKANATQAELDAGVAGTLELDAKHADRVIMTFDTKEEAAHAIRIMQQEAEAQTLRDVKTVVSPSITVPDPVAAVKDLAGRAIHDPLGTAGDVLNPINQAKAVIGVGQTAVNGVVQDVKSFFNNPLTGNNGDNAPPPGTIEIPIGSPVTTLAGQMLDRAAEQVEPSAADKAFLQSHVTGYETAVSAQERATLEAKLGKLVAIDGRVAAIQTLTRTVTLPKPAQNGQPAQPGTVSYEYKGGVVVDARSRLKLGPPLENLIKRAGGAMPQVNGLPVSLGGGLNTVTPLATASQSTKITFAMTPEQSNAVTQSRGETIPGITDLGKPTAADVTLQGRALVPGTLTPPVPGVVPGSAYYANFTLTGSVANPAGTLDTAKDQLLGGNLSDTFETLARNSTVTGEATLTHQEGGNISAVASGSIKNKLQVGEAWAIATGTAQTDTVVGRAKGQIKWQDDPPRQTTPPRPPVQPEPPELPAQPTPYQVAVVPHAGLNIRAEPGTDAKVLGPAYSGTFLQATGRTQTDAQGRKWLEVHGPDMFRQEQKGWVASEFVERHPEGAMAPASGRINELREQGYVAVPVKPGDTISGIALKNGVAPKDAVVANNGHVIDVDLIFPGDTVYIPGR